MGFFLGGLNRTKGSISLFFAAAASKPGRIGRVCCGDAGIKSGWWKKNLAQSALHFLPALVVNKLDS